ncbi:hypothetical protein N7495_007061 [Penicillium taxi]|uniref:uncharacterized protein n=1 Tax=Penicillium taxi TaxID=168475 RepID=UPI00254546B4|nr:uncharacterized protein N7495_007061 [Penicillium taxi]KAJ5895370.1 hypothetical protein N7495_007061 [Penicillium taxi]
MASIEVETVRVYKGLVDSLLDRATQVKSGNEIEPPLTESLLGEAIWKFPDDQDKIVQQLTPLTRFAAVEIAFRERFYRILASTSINDPSFIHIWNLLDIVSLFSDKEQCEPGLIFWLIEELLDSQTIDGCRKVFDYLESRRERNIKKHFKQKSLVILRSCNELLRRLSRAEDTVFCGRVFIFLFQSFPLGDKSSVNLRGEFHTENFTTFDEIKYPSPEVDYVDTTMTEANEDTIEQAEGSEEGSQIPKVVVSTYGTAKGNVNLDALYPTFWNLQAYFSAPSKTFDSECFASFRAGLEATLSAFKNIKTEFDNQSGARFSEDARKAIKRKRTTDEAEIGTSFNPKYLTSRDLFGLEISDMAFRRHVLVQALILLDFLLSLTPKSKSLLANCNNKSVRYDFTLSDEDTKWTIQMRKDIEDYLQQGSSGKFYYRMVDTVLSRDKNWVHWKAEGCPPIERSAISVEDYNTSRENALKLYVNKRLRSSPMGALDVNFLSDNEALANNERLKESSRYSIPAADNFLMGIMDDEMDIDTAKTPAEKQAALESKSCKSWRLLRLAAKTKLATFDKIEDGDNLKILFETPAAPAETQHGDGSDDIAQQDQSALDLKETQQPTEESENAAAAQSIETLPDAKDTPQESVESPKAEDKMSPG